MADLPTSDSLRSSIPRGAFLAAGLAIGLMGVGLFGVVHAIAIVPIWTLLAGGVPFALCAGLAMGWALYELRLSVPPHWRPAVAMGFGAIVWATLIPMTLFSLAVRMTGLHSQDDGWEVLGESLLSAGTGAAAGWLLGRRWRPALAQAAASLAVTLTQAGPIPVANSARAAWLFAGLSVLYVASGPALALVAAGLSRYVVRSHSSRSAARGQAVQRCAGADELLLRSARPSSTRPRLSAGARGTVEGAWKYAVVSRFRW